MSERMYSLRTVPLSVPHLRRQVEEMLAANGLRPDVPELYIGVYDDDDTLLGGGGLDGGVIKCVALDESLRGEAISNTLITELLGEARRRGHRNVFLYTKPENERLFTSLSFRTVARADKALMMETDRRGISGYCTYLTTLRRPGTAGAIVMHCNPVTRGHLHLIRTAAADVDTLYIIPVAEEGTRFPYTLRRQMLIDATRDIPNVVVAEGSRYAVSRATFPSYFLKQADDATDTSILLDLDIFKTHIAPALGATIRFAGTEPLDPLTSRYNDLMAATLPAAGIEFRTVERIGDGTEVISASRVRRLLDEHRGGEALSLVSPEALPRLLAYLSAEAMRAELMLSPKPGLVDRFDNGAHSDMDLPLMARSIDVLEEGLASLAAIDDAEELLAEGRRVEKEMFDATGGVNTYKGALFSMALTLNAARRIIGRGDDLTAKTLSEEISRLAAQLPGGSGTHGSVVRERYGVAGALDSARAGYPLLFSSWLPALRENLARYDRDEALRLTLMAIIAEMDDTNVLHRAGRDGAEWLKTRAREILADFSADAIAALNRECIDRNISPGGAADMLSLTFVIYTITTQ